MPAETRERILDVAEELFADQGISGTSLRALTRAADVNLAAVHYHFGSKEALLDAVVQRRAEPLNRERLGELDRLQEDGQTPGVEAILAALFAVGVRSLRGEVELALRLSRLVARLEAQPAEVVEPIYRKHFGELARRFVDALCRALPDLPKETVADRYRFAAGTLSFVFSGNFDLDVIPGHPAHSSCDEDKIAQVIAFLAAGFRAPALDLRAHPTDSPKRCAP